MSKISITIRIIIAICLFFFGMFFYGKFVPMYLIDKPGVKYQTFSATWQLKNFLIFSSCVAAVPMISIFLNLKKIKNIVLSAGVVVIFLVVAIFLKRSLVSTKINKRYSEELYERFGVEYSLPLQRVLPEIFMLLSLILVTLLLLFLKNRKVLFKYDSEESGNFLNSQLLSNK